MKPALLAVLAAFVLLSGCAIQPNAPSPAPADAQQPNQQTGDTGIASDFNESQDQNTVPQAETAEEKLQECKKIENNSNRDNCIKALAKSEKTPDFCLELSVLDKDSCIKEISVLESSAEYCEKISVTEKRRNCFYEVAEKTLDYTFCEKIADDGNSMQRDYCITNVAEKTGDYNTCEFVSGATAGGKFLQDECYFQFESNHRSIEFCKKYLSDSRKEECLGKVAEEQSTVNACLELDENEEIDCLYELGMGKADFTICELIPADENRQVCIDYAAEQAPDLNVCYKATKGEVRNNCYKEAGIKDLNFETCVLIPISDQMDDCYYGVAIDSNNSELCSRIHAINYDKKDTCFQTIALQTLEYNVCESVWFEDNYLDCFVQIAAKAENSGICSEIEKNHFTTGYSIYPPEMLCYKDYAVETSDTAACENIVNATLNQQCIDLNASFH